MKAHYTYLELSALPPEEFIQVCKAFPNGGDYLDPLAFQYAATRLARMQGLIVKEDIKNNKQ